MLRVGLTGSIAVGKSFVLECFRELGCHVLDADKTAREVVEPGTVGLKRVVEVFGDGILEKDGGLDRKKLGAIVFSDSDKIELLNSIIHPMVFEKQNAWLDNCELEDPNGIAIVDAALMIESGSYTRFVKLIVVWCKDEIQLARLIKRDNLTEDEARMRIGSQMPQDEKKKYADFLIDTSSSHAETRKQVNEIFNALARLNR